MVIGKDLLDGRVVPFPGLDIVSVREGPVPLGTQNLITYNIDDIPTIPPDEGDGKYRVEVNTDTQTETEVRNKKTYEYSGAVGVRPERA